MYVGAAYAADAFAQERGVPWAEEGGKRMAEKDDDTTEAWRRRSHVRLEELPQADPIAYLGTERHPVSMPRTTASIPPTTHDVEPSASMEEGAGAATKSHLSRRIAAAAIGLAIILPMAVSLSSSDDVANAPATRASIPPPKSPDEHARQNAQLSPTDLPPGGVTEAALPEGEPPLSSQQSVADWKQPAAVPTASDRSTAISENVSRSDSATSAKGEQSTSSAPRGGSADVKPASTVRRETPRRRAAVVAKPFDFTAAMNAVTATSLGPVQCGPDAIGATAVAITFAPSGDATHAVIENGPLRGTQTGSCVARQLRGVRIAPFDGTEPATLRTSVLLR
jgi:hypothetical protein